MIPGTCIATMMDAAFAAITNTYNTGTAATETIPNGAMQMVVTEWGGGGGGATGRTAGISGGGGASGAYCTKTFALASADWGKTLTYTVGALGLGASTGDGQAGSASTITNNTFATAVAMTANGGGGGKDGNITGNQGTPGIASGGTTNTSGNGSGGATPVGRGAPNGGADVGLETVGTAPGGGGGGGLGGDLSDHAGANGSPGRVQFAYT